MPLAERAPTYPDLVPIFPGAGRMQRAAADLLGVMAEGFADRRPWLDHGTWPEQYLPLRRDGEMCIRDRPYMRVERDHGKMTPRRLRVYHSMYQLFGFTMLLALTTNNMGILWVAMEAATLTTVLLVSVYRTAASLEAAWKYFILCGVGIAQALFGTVLLYICLLYTSRCV